MRAKLEEVAKVGPHGFFRWRGFWGTRNALSARYGGGEPDPLRLQETALTVATANPLTTLMQGGEAVRSITTELVNQTTEAGDATPSSPGAGIHFVLVSSSDSPAALVDKARALCGSEGYCRVQGWSDASNIPAKLPLTEEARRSVLCHYLKLVKRLCGVCRPRKKRQHWLMMVKGVKSCSVWPYSKRV